MFLNSSHIWREFMLCMKTLPDGAPTPFEGRVFNSLLPTVLEYNTNTRSCQCENRTNVCINFSYNYSRNNIVLNLPRRS